MDREEGRGGKTGRGWMRGLFLTRKACGKVRKKEEHDEAAENE